MSVHLSCLLACLPACLSLLLHSMDVVFEGTRLASHVSSLPKHSENSHILLIVTGGSTEGWRSQAGEQCPGQQPEGV